MSRGNGVKGHTRSGADDESRTRGLGHGVAALCQLSYIRKGARRTIGQYRGRLAQLVKERPPRAAVRSIDRCLRRSASGCGLKNKEARILVKNPGLCVQSLEGARLRAALSRMHSVLVPIKLPAANGWLESAADRIDLMQGDVACAQRPHRRGAHERDQTLDGSVGSCDVPGFHDEAL
jgi:hypothetical protein